MFLRMPLNNFTDNLACSEFLLGFNEFFDYSWTTQVISQPFQYLPRIIKKKQQQKYHSTQAP